MSNVSVGTVVNDIHSSFYATVKVYNAELLTYLKMLSCAVERRVLGQVDVVFYESCSENNEGKYCYSSQPKGKHPCDHLWAFTHSLPPGFINHTTRDIAPK